MNRGFTRHGFRAERHIRAVGLLLAALCMAGCRTDEPPEAAFEVFPASGPAPLTVTFDASASRDTDGEIVSFAWRFPNAPTATGVRAQHTFEAAGEYVVKLTVTDDDGLSATATKTIRVSENNSASRRVGPSGGTLDFGGGLTMTFPAGAVPEETTVTARPIQTGDVEGLYGTSPASLEETRILGGFVTESSIHQFDVPVVVTVLLGPRRDESARVAHARMNDNRDGLKLTKAALPVAPGDGSASLSMTSFSPNIIFEYAQYLSLTSADAGVKLQVFLGVDQAYTQGNRGEEGFLDFAGGQQQALEYLASRIGKPYDGANLFCGFDLTIVSTVVSADPAAADVVNSGTVSTSKQSCGTEFTRLYEAEPWMNAALQNRSYTNTVVTPNTEKQEIYDIAVTAYIRPHNVKFQLEKVSAGLDIHDGRLMGEEWVTTSQDFSRTPIDLPVDSPVPMPADFAEEALGTYRGGTGRAWVEVEIVKDGWGFALRSAGSVTKQDGRYLYLDEWFPSPLTTVYSPVEVNAIVRIDNPEAREVTVQVDHAGRCDGPEPLVGPWQQQTMDIVPVTGNDPENPTIISIYGAFGDDANSHAGSKSLKFRSEEIVLALFFEPHYIRATDFFADQLKYRIGCSSEVLVSVLGLAP
jgi:PKD repeat protein